MNEDGLAYAQTFSQCQSYEESKAQKIGSSQNLSNTNELDFSWNSGFRIKIGYRMPHDAWEIPVTWTRLHSRANGPTLIASPYALQNPLPQNYAYCLNNQIRALWIGGSSTSFGNNSQLFTVNAGLKVHLNVLDGELARFFQVTPALAFKPHIGVRGLWISQYFHSASRREGLVELRDFDGLASSFIKFQTSSLCRGVGIRCGLDVDWEFYKDWGLYGNIGGSLLSAMFNQKTKQIGTSTVTETKGFFQEATSRQVNEDSKHGVVLPTLDCMLGFFWNHSFDQEVSLRIQAGWEFNDFFNQNRMLGNLPGDLTYQGLTTSIRLDF